MDAAYDGAGVSRYAAWVHESDEGMRAALSSRGNTLDACTRAKGMWLADVSLAPAEVELAPPDWLSSCGSSAWPPACSAVPIRARFHILVARLCGENVEGIALRDRVWLTLTRAL